VTIWRSFPVLVWGGLIGGFCVQNVGSVMASTPKKAAKSAEGQPLLVRNYEVQRYASGRWMVDSVADEKEVALAMAQSLMKSGKAPHGLRVMAVQTKPNGEYSQITIYRRMPGEPEPAAGAPAKPAPKAEAKPEAEKRDFKHVDPPAKPAKAKKGGQILLALKIAFIVGFAVVAFEAIHLLSK
jgi:hypothetical protein